MDTTQVSVPPGPGAWAPPTPPRRRRTHWLAVPLLLVLMLAVGAAFVPLSYYAIAPGSATGVDHLISVRGARSYRPRGQVLFLTVSVGRVGNVYAALTGWLDPAVDVIPERHILPPDQSPRQYEQENVQLMQGSKQTAQYVALRKLGYRVEVKGEGAVISGVDPRYPAARLLHKGDVVVDADGRPVRLHTELVDAIRAHRAGDTIRLRVRGSDTPATRDVTVSLGRRDDGSPILGVDIGTFRQRLDLPFRVDIDSGEVGGPSAGLAFTLALIDRLTPGELTGGQRVAVTGTIEPDGRVGPVGGVAQKTVAVRRAGAPLLLVPRAEYREAKAHAGRHLRVEAVDTLDQALRALASLHGSNALALGRRPAQ